MNKLLFVYSMPKEHEIYWQDGLWAALQELEKDFEIKYLNVWDNPKWEETFDTYPADFTLGWGSPTSPFFYKVYARLSHAGWCVGGGNPADPHYENFGVVFVENKSYLLRSNYRLAFGTNTDLFFKMEIPKMFDAIYPAAFAAWKHQEIFAKICQSENKRGLAVGYIQKNNLAESLGLISQCLAKGVAVLDWVPASSLVYLYNMAKEVLITADSSGGCERAILEAKACDLPVRVIGNSDKLHEWNKLTTEEVRTNWNHLEYARKLREGINEAIDNRK